MSRTMIGDEGRQTYIQEFENDNVDPVSAFPYALSKDIVNGAPGRKTHLVPVETMDGDVGDTYCGRWKATAEIIESRIQALRVVHNLCALCYKRLHDHELEALARMANANSDRDITVEDLKS